MSEAPDPEAYLKHARSKRKDLRKNFSADRADLIVALVTESLDRFSEHWSATYSAETGRLMRVLDGVDRALAALIANRWTWEEGYPAPYGSEEEAYRWLQGSKTNEDAGEPAGYLESETDWAIRSLWNVKEDVEKQLSAYDSWNKHRDRNHWAILPETASRLPAELQVLINDLCTIWHDYVDEALQLPERTPKPDNPLLRFIDAILAIAVGAERPEKKKVLTLIKMDIRPAVRRAADEEAEQEMEATAHQRARRSVAEY